MAGRSSVRCRCFDYGGALLQVVIALAGVAGTSVIASVLDVITGGYLWLF